MNYNNSNSLCSNPELVGKRLRSLRNEKGCTQVDTAEYLGTSQSVISRLEKNPSNISAEMVSQLSRFYGVSSDYILGHTSIREEMVIDYNQALQKSRILLHELLEYFEDVKKKVNDADHPDGNHSDTVI